MAAAQAAVHGVEEMEEAAHTNAQAHRPGTGSGMCPRKCLQWPWPVVECGRIAHECGSSDRPLPENGPRLIAGGGSTVCDAAPAAVFMNRRDTEPYVRWCGRTVGVSFFPPTRFPD